MKYILTSFLLILCFLGLSQQNLSADYDVTLTIKSENLNKEIISTDVFYTGYFFKKNNSFLSYIKPSNKSIDNNYKIITSQQGANSSAIHLFKDSIQQITFINTDSFYLKAGKQSNVENQFCMYFTIGENKWEILPDTKTILQIKCQKAILKKKDNDPIVIWFAPNIKCGGIDILGLRDVPGLIMEFERKNEKVTEIWRMKNIYIDSKIDDTQMTLKELEGSCTPRRKLSPEQLEANKKRVDILTQVDF